MISTAIFLWSGSRTVVTSGWMSWATLRHALQRPQGRPSPAVHSRAAAAKRAAERRSAPPVRTMAWERAFRAAAERRAASAWLWPGRFMAGITALLSVKQLNRWIIAYGQGKEKRKNAPFTGTARRAGVGTLMLRRGGTPGPPPHRSAISHSPVGAHSMPPAARPRKGTGRRRGPSFPAFS